MSITNEEIKLIFLENGFSIKEGLDDLKPYVYEAARKVIKAVKIGEVVVTTNEAGECVAVTRQDEDGKILSVIWER